MAACGDPREPPSASRAVAPALGDAPARDARPGTHGGAGPAVSGSPGRGLDADAELARAARLRRAMWGLEGVELERARAVAVAAYRALRRRCLAAGETGAGAGIDARRARRAAAAEAAFRAGELLRAGGDGVAAATEFRLAVALGAGTEFRPRARLELGHLARRAERWDTALEAYEEVATDASAAPETRAEGALWSGRVDLERGRPDDARRTFRRIARSARDPLDRVRAYDLWALGYVASEDPEAAAGVLAELAETLRPAASEATELGERVRSALEACRSFEELRAAVDRRRRAREASPPATVRSGESVPRDAR